MHPRNNGRGGLPSALSGIASIVAFIGMIYAAPLIWPVIDGKIWSSLTGLYGRDLSVLLYWGAKLGLYPLSFFALRAALSAVFMAAMLFAFKRLI